MTLDEAIKHCEEKAEELKQQIISDEYICNQGYKDNHNEKCLECAKEHEQLAEWLKDYKRLREISIKCDDCFYKKEFENRINNGEHI